MSLNMSRQVMQHLIGDKLPVIKTEKNEVGSRKLSVLSLGYEHSFHLSDKSTLYLNPSISSLIEFGFFKFLATVNSVSISLF
jgi:hypothetical protein